MNSHGRFLKTITNDGIEYELFYNCANYRFSVTIGTMTVNSIVFDLDELTIEEQLDKFKEYPLVKQLLRDHKIDRLLK